MRIARARWFDSVWYEYLEGRIKRWPPWQKPMRGSLLNRSHPLARGLIGSLVFNESGGSGVFLHGTNILGDIGPSMTWGVGVGGGALKGGTTYDDANNLISLGSVIDPRSWPGVTIFIYADFFVGGDYPAIIAHVPTGNYYGCFQLETNPSGADITFRWRAGNSGDSLDWVTPTGTQTAAFTWVRQGTRRIYIDGVDKANGEQTTDWYQSANYPTTINGYDRDGAGDWRTCQHRYYAMHIYDRDIGPDAIAQLHREPYGMFL